MRRQHTLSTSDVADLSTLAQQYLLCPCFFNKFLDQFVKLIGLIIHFGKVSMVVKPGVKRLLCTIFLLSMQF